MLRCTFMKYVNFEFEKKRIWKIFIAFEFVHEIKYILEKDITVQLNHKWLFIDKY